MQAEITRLQEKLQVSDKARVVQESAHRKLLEEVERLRTSRRTYGPLYASLFLFLGLLYVLVCWG